MSCVWVGMDGDEIVSGHLPRNQKVKNVERDGRVAISIETDKVRWAHLEISIREHSRLDNLITAMLDLGTEAAAGFGGPMVVRCTLRGNGPLHRDLQRDGLAVRDQSLV